jgi:hypothetical protein
MNDKQGTGDVGVVVELIALFVADHARCFGPPSSNIDVATTTACSPDAPSRDDAFIDRVAEICVTARALDEGLEARTSAPLVSVLASIEATRMQYRSMMRSGQLNVH